MQIDLHIWSYPYHPRSILCKRAPFWLSRFRTVNSLCICSSCTCVINKLMLSPVIHGFYISFIITNVASGYIYDARFIHSFPLEIWCILHEDCCSLIYISYIFAGYALICAWEYLNKKLQSLLSVAICVTGYCLGRRPCVYQYIFIKAYQ